MRFTSRFSTKKRADLWARETFSAYIAGRGMQPICNLCDQPVADDAEWHESHCPSKPKAFGGKSVGIAHALCNLNHGRTVVTPMVRKADRVHKKHHGLKGPGLGRYPMRAGRRSNFTKTMNRGLQPRLDSAAKHAAFLARRSILPIDNCVIQGGDA